MVADFEIQRIARLTPLADVLASFDLSIGPVEPREEAVSKALGLTLAASAVIAEGHPKSALVLRDGYAVRSDTTLDASSYAPAPLSPAPTRVETGDTLPAEADAVAAFDIVQMCGTQAEALAAVPSPKRSFGRGHTSAVWPVQKPHFLSPMGVITYYCVD